jgi:hypothetical protein
MAYPLVFLVLLSLLVPAEPTVVPLVPTPAGSAYMNAWSHVQSYRGTVSGDAVRGKSPSLNEHFQSTVTLTRVGPVSPDGTVSFLAFTQLAGSGTAGNGCGSGNVTPSTTVAITLHLYLHTYDVNVAGPLSVICSDGKAHIGPVGQFSAQKVLLPAPASGICGTLTENFANDAETDVYKWNLVPVTDAHWKINVLCQNIVQKAQ